MEGQVTQAPAFQELPNRREKYWANQLTRIPPTPVIDFMSRRALPWLISEGRWEGSLPLTRYFIFDKLFEL